MAEVKFFKVSTLPASPLANSWYLVNNGDYAETYVTDNLGILKKIGNSAMINELINDALVTSNNNAYTHTQGVASDTWVINHNLNYYPNISIVDSGGTVVIGNITYTNANRITVTFSGAFSGSAYLS